VPQAKKVGAIKAVHHVLVELFPGEVMAMIIAGKQPKNLAT